MNPSYIRLEKNQINSGRSEHFVYFQIPCINDRCHIKHSGNLLKGVFFVLTFSHCTNHINPVYTASSHITLYYSYPVVKIKTLVATDSQKQVRTTGITETLGTYHFFQRFHFCLLSNKLEPDPAPGKNKKMSKDRSILIQESW